MIYYQDEKASWPVAFSPFFLHQENKFCKPIFLPRCRSRHIQNKKAVMSSCQPDHWQSQRFAYRFIVILSFFHPMHCRKYLDHWLVTLTWDRIKLGSLCSSTQALKSWKKKSLWMSKSPSFEQFCVLNLSKYPICTFLRWTFTLFTYSARYFTAFTPSNSANYEVAWKCQNWIHSFLLRYTNLEELQEKIESTRYRRGFTFTAMALSKSLELFAKDARYDKDTAKVTEDDDKNDTEKTKF